MHHRRLRPFRPTRGRHTWLARLQMRGEFLLLLVSLLFTPVVLYTVPRVWVDTQSTQAYEAWKERAWPYYLQAVKRWSEQVNLPPFTQGDEPEVVELLRTHPLLVAVTSTEGDTLWVRKGDQLRPAESSNREARQFRRWADRARSSPERWWNPPAEEHAEHLREAVAVCRNGRWLTIHRWRLGSLEVERHLRLSLGDPAPLRIWLRRENPSERPDPEPTPALWALPSHIQIDAPEAQDFGLYAFSNVSSLGEGWELGAIATEKDEAQFHRTLIRRRFEAYALSLGLVLSLWTGLFLRHRARKRERLEMDRMASMAHSLKTPLGILKLRCDSIRLGQFDPTQTQYELMRIGEEVDNLTAFIDQSLKGFRRTESAHPRAQVPPQWFKELAEDLEPAFMVEGKTLRLELEDGVARAHAPTLRTALVTLLENALMYGDGDVTLTTQKRGKAFRITVRNGGPGLDEQQLNQVAKPFMRFRIPGAEGFEREGQGLGLFLLHHTAVQEGWGLGFHSAPGEGFLAVLDIHT